MTVLGIGVDIVHTPRIAALLARRGSQRLATRILSPEESSQWETLSSSDVSAQVRFLAVRWALKEAAYKAIFPVARPTWKEFTYCGLDSSKGRKPTLVYKPHISTGRSKVGRMHISISHDGEYVVASVLVEKIHEQEISEY